MATPCSKIGIYGGSFAPVHKGHLNVAHSVLQAGLVDEVVMIPCYKNPLKDKSDYMADEERLSLLQKSIRFYEEGKIEEIADNPFVGRIHVSEIELKKKGISYTWDTLQMLSAESPDKQFRIIIGADSYIGFSKWKNASRIASEFSPIVYPRPGFPISKIEKEFTLLEGVEEFDVSSSEIRKEKINAEIWMPWMKN